MDSRRARSLLGALVVVGWALPAAAQVTTITIRESDPATGYDETDVFTCQGSPVCAGTFTTSVREVGCPNYYSFGGTISISGLDFSRSGTFSGSFTMDPGFRDAVKLPNGQCTAGASPPAQTASYTMTYDAATGGGSGKVFGQNQVFPFTFKADVSAPAAVFPMVVRSSIGPVTSSASADIQFRAQDVGTTGAVFVFAAAPATVVQGSSSPLAMRLGKADAASCVLAQLDGSGKLVAVTNNQFQAAVSGVLSAQGATVSIMNNVSTPAVAGATFYVGYGASGATMLDGGIFRNAVLVPGNGVCPMLPYATALWWNPSESGWGLNLNQQGNLAFATLFTYDASRAPMWLVMSAGALQSDGATFSGDLYRTTGPAFNANPFTPIGPGNVTKVGTMSIAFSHANAGTLTYTVDGTQVVKSIQRQVYGSRPANCMPSSATSRAASAQYQDLWWNPDESGWGLNLTHQDDTFFATLFTYDANGKGLWLVMSAGQRQSDGSFQGPLYRTAGPVFNAAPFTPISGSDVTPVGSMTLRFQDGDRGTLAYTYAGATVTKSIQRQVFSAPVSACR